VWPNNHIHVLRPKFFNTARFITYALNVTDYSQFIDGSTRDKLTQSSMAEIPIPWPCIDEQHAIAAFLDCGTAKIDALIAEQQRLIALLAEKRQAVISHAVTKGLNPDAPMKDSGIEWLGEVPAHWTLIRLRGLFRQEKRQNQFGKPVLSVYRDFGVILKDSRDDNMNKTPDDLSAYQLVNPSDLVVNKMKAWQGSLGVSDLEGITSPDYVVFTPRHRESSTFLHLLLRSQRMVTIYRSISNGIRPSQWRLEPDLFLGLPAFLPPGQEQRDVVSFITDQTSRFDVLTAEAQRAIALLQERRTALISAAVTGKIDVRGYSSAETPALEMVS
jgi:type I restriction enzyme S subunit